MPDWGDLWSGGLGAVAMLLSVLAYRRKQTRVVADFVSYPVVLPGEESSGVLTARLREKLRASDLSLDALSLEIERSQQRHSVGMAMIGNVRNRGHETVEMVELQLGGATLVEVRRSDHSIHEMEGGVSVRLKDLRPDEDATIRAWAPRDSYTHVGVLLSRGRARVKYKRHDLPWY